MNLPLSKISFLNIVITALVFSLVLGFFSIKNTENYYENRVEQQEKSYIQKNKKQTNFKAKKYKIGDTYYALNQETKEIYDLESYMNNNIVKLGKLVKLDNGNYEIEFI